jgi:hypothetical protein
VISVIRHRHDMKSAQALPAKSTVGIVLEGTMVNIIVPGSPSYRENAQGQRIEPGDQVIRRGMKRLDASRNLRLAPDWLCAHLTMPFS